MSSESKRHASPAEANGRRTATIRLAREATRSHYDRYPFFLHPHVGPAAERFFELSLTGELIRSHLAGGGRVLDVGCGTGRVSAWLVERAGLRPIAIDLSLRELVEARATLPLVAVNADNLCLPFADAIADVTISAGVIHHTPDPRLAFSELCRVTRPGGIIHVAVYQIGSLYHRLYRLASRPCRSIRRWGGERALRSTLFPLYYVAFRVYFRLGLRVREELRADLVWRFFMDQFLTPQVSFHTREELERWAAEESLQLLQWQPEFRGEQVSFIFRKE